MYQDWLKDYEAILKSDVEILGNSKIDITIKYLRTIIEQPNTPHIFWNHNNVPKEVKDAINILLEDRTKIINKSKKQNEKIKKQQEELCRLNIKVKEQSKHLKAFNKSILDSNKLK